MAGDWIKMRVWLARDPRVIRMADHLACERAFMDWLTDPVQQSCKETAYEHVTRNVTVALCVTGLLVTWGTAREQGDRENDDLVVSHCDRFTLDAMTDIPCFGEAMIHVGWAIEREDDALVFPKFFRDNESPDDRHRRQNAERQARFRNSHRNEEVTTGSNVTVTHREEKRREVKPKGVARLEPEGFTRFWAAWPKHKRKAAKQQCLARWVSKQLEGRADEIVAHVDAWKRSEDWMKEGGQFIPAPLVYLGQDRFDAPPAGGSAAPAGDWRDAL